MDFAVKRVDLSTIHFTAGLLEHVPPDIARKYRVLPLFESADTLCLAVTDPFDLRLVDELHHALKRELDLRQADQQQIDLFLQRLYGDRME